MDWRYLFKLASQVWIFQCWSHFCSQPKNCPQVYVALSQDIFYCWLTFSSSAAHVSRFSRSCCRCLLKAPGFSSSTTPKTLRLSVTGFIFLLIAVQILLPQSMNWRSGVLINDFPDMHLEFLLWVIGDKRLRIADQSWPRDCVTVIRFYLLVKHVPAETLAQMTFPHRAALTIPQQ